MSLERGPAETFGWRWTGRERPPFAERPGEGQESVWDYPRPPRLERDSRRILVKADKTVVADTLAATRVLETASPPTFYLPPSDVRMELLHPAPGASHCEWKGTAKYWSVRTVEDHVVPSAAWTYDDPLPAFEAIRGFVSFYPSKVECYVDGERVRPQHGGFYGGWVTSELVGPFKGGRGSSGW